MLTVGVVRDGDGGKGDTGSQSVVLGGSCYVPGSLLGVLNVLTNVES